MASSHTTNVSPRVHREDMLFNGTRLEWYGHGSFRATSGLPGHQNASQQSHSDEGPIPEGLYSFQVKLSQDANMISKTQLDHREGIEHIPSVLHFHGGNYEARAWGSNRVRLSTVYIQDPKNRSRGGFYLHDSTKGYSHGCIEVDGDFFRKLRAYAKLPLAKRSGHAVLYVAVQ
ncbi:MAG: DUF2778 domain-containing protein [Planctomycetota bacterium]|nr:DUF2778 domain-containing protein [Planctomycetota bacterium]